MKKLVFMLCMIPAFVFCQDPVLMKSVDMKANEVSIKSESENISIIEVNVIINEVLAIDFILDTGASDSSIPLYVLNTLIATKTVEVGDLLDSKKYRIANGGVVTNKRIMIRKIFIGGRMLENIPFSITEDVNSPLLIGQNILGKFTEVKIDYKNKILTFIE